MLASVVSLPASAFPPLAVGFMGLGTGYLIYGLQELFGYPRRSVAVDFGTGMWGIWLPGFMQLFSGVYLFAGLDLFHTFTDKGLYMAALAFTAYGIHWFAIGWNRLREADVRTNVGMTIGYFAISLLGVIAFFGAHDQPVGGLFIGLTCVYGADFFASMKPDLPRVGAAGERLLGFFHLCTGGWLLYLMFATVLNFVLGWGLPL
ncbi:MAG TPA: hypothetical protein VNF07_11235 [Acidimicrobiales bacterium]|nr:hypothetical protein [Acidimicrobiales bacterium]